MSPSGSSVPTATDHRDEVAARRAEARARILEAARDLAAEHGIGAISLRELGRRVGMRAPSLYEYFDSKHAIYDALFAAGYRSLLDEMDDLVVAAAAVDPGDPAAVRAALLAGMRRFLGFCVADPARYQLMFQRPVPGYEPSPEAYGPSVELLAEMRSLFDLLGIRDPAHLDLWTAVTTGLADQQIANDPGGDRWLRLDEEAVDMLLAHIRREGKR